MVLLLPLPMLLKCFILVKSISTDLPQNHFLSSRSAFLFFRLCVEQPKCQSGLAILQQSWKAIFWWFMCKEQEKFLRNLKSALAIYYKELGCLIWSLATDAVKTANFSISPKVECFWGNTEFQRNDHMFDIISRCKV